MVVERPAGPLGVGPRLTDDRSHEPTSLLTETALIRGYAAGEALLARVEACACGGTIRSLDGPRAIAFTVEIHNASPRHAQWRLWREAD